MSQGCGGARLFGLAVFFFSITCSITLCLCVSNASVAAPLVQQTKAPQTNAQQANASKHAPARKRSAAPAKPPVASSLAEQQLERLAHELHEHPMGLASERLAEFAHSEQGTPIGARAALALAS